MSETQTAVNAIEMRGIVMEFSGVSKAAAPSVA